ncbi:MAG: hypothetical protein OXC84_13645 [Gammaproteobacteria bacterium]|nr:hypothetical protein [Gammaproteobacteria bacterium]
MGALANYIERAGVATTSISLIREQSEVVCPPRALWVPFALGRPLGSADDPEFQKDVMRAAFGMLATASEPTIVDYPRDAPEEAEPGEWACPVSFPVKEDESHTARLVAEVTRLAPWSNETRTARGRTLFGVTGATPDQIEAVARALGTIADHGDVTEPPDVGIGWKFSMPLLVRHLADDMRTFYHEAIASQPGTGAPNHDALTDWIFGNTALGDALLAIAEHLTVDDRPISLIVRGWMIPEGHFRGGSAFPAPEQIARGGYSPEELNFDIGPGADE